MVEVDGSAAVVAVLATVVVVAAVVLGVDVAGGAVEVVAGCVDVVLVLVVDVVAVAALVDVAGWLDVVLVTGAELVDRFVVGDPVCPELLASLGVVVVVSSLVSAVVDVADELSLVVLVELDPVVPVVVTTAAELGATEVSEPSADTGGESSVCSIVVDDPSSAGVLPGSPHAAANNVRAPIPRNERNMIMPTPRRAGSHVLCRVLYVTTPQSGSIGEALTGRRNAPVDTARCEGREPARLTR